MNRKQRKIRRKFVRSENKQVNRKIASLRETIDEVLQEYGRRLYKLKRDDELRLLTLYSWRERYRVSIKWILRILIPIWSNRFSRYQIGRVSLGCRVPTLVGRKSEEIIREHVSKEFKNGENQKEWQTNETARIERIVGKRKIDRRRKLRNKSILQTSSVGRFLKNYRKGLKWRISETNEQELNRIKRKPYRGNPWL